jgi:hypothetical protein
VFLPRTPAASNNPPINASRYPIDRNNSWAVASGRSGEPHSRFARSGSTKNEIPEAIRNPPTATAAPSIDMAGSLGPGSAGRAQSAQLASGHDPAPR